MRGARALTLAVVFALWTGASPAHATSPGTASVIPGSGSCAGCNLVIISLDTLRRDRLEPFGYERPTSPTLRSLAERALVFDAAYSTSAKTAEAHMSLFTSLDPSVHGVETLDTAKVARGLAPGVATLADLLKARGYDTAGFHSGGHVAGELGFARGFDVYENSPFMRGPGWSATRAWLRSRSAERPFFLFLHTYHVHDPYTPTAGMREMFAPDYEGPIVSDRRGLERRARARCQGVPDCSSWLVWHRLFWEPVRRDDPREVAHLSSLYDAEIREVDAVLPRVLSAIEAAPGPALIVILSDHGEAFGEHGAFTHKNLYQEVVRVPLMVVHPKAPGSAGRRAAEPVSLVDVAPTVLDWLGIEPPDTLQGRALGRSGGDHAAGETAVFMELPSHDMIAVARSGKKLLLNAEESPSDERVLARVREIAAGTPGADIGPVRSVELYDLDADPGETRDLGPADPDFESLLRLALERGAANASLRDALGAAPTPAAIPDALVRQLEALGYLE